MTRTSTPKIDTTRVHVEKQNKKWGRRGKARRPTFKSYQAPLLYHENLKVVVVVDHAAVLGQSRPHVRLLQARAYVQELVVPADLWCSVRVRVSVCQQSMARSSK